MFILVLFLSVFALAQSEQSNREIENFKNEILAKMQLMAEQYDGKMKLMAEQHNEEIKQIKEKMTEQQQQIQQNLQECRSRGNTAQNETCEMEERVTSLEEDMVVLQDDMVDLADDIEEVESDISFVVNDMNYIRTDVARNEEYIQELHVADNLMQGEIEVIEGIIHAPWEACQSSPCENSGMCIDVNVDTFICMCRDGYFGVTCDQTPLEACQNSPCENSATCIDVNVDTFMCQCRDGYFGVTCGQSYVDTTFMASLSADFSDYDVVFDDVHINSGGYYDGTTGVYTVPYNGTYQFSVHLTSDSSSQTIRFRIYVDGSIIHYDTYYDSYYRDTTIVLDLTQGQQVNVYNYGAYTLYGHSSYMVNYFSGSLLHAH